MRRAMVFWIAFVGGLVSPALAQQVSGIGHATFGTGICQHGVPNVSFGGGGSVLLWRGITAGAEVDLFRFVEQNSQPIILGTVNVGYQFGKRTRAGKVNPFVDFALLGLGVGGGEYLPAGHLSGGLDYWFKPRIGLRTEFRLYGIGGETIAMFRIGVSFR